MNHRKYGTYLLFWFCLYVSFINAKMPIDRLWMHHSVKALLQPNGITSAAFPLAAFGGNFYVSVRHRNSIKTWSKLPVTFNNYSVNYSFK